MMIKTLIEENYMKTESLEVHFSVTNHCSPEKKLCIFHRFKKSIIGRVSTLYGC